MPGKFGAGDFVRVIRVPSLANPDFLHTKLAFELCLGRTYKVQGVNEIGWLELDVSADVDEVLGTFGNTIWIETEYVESAAGRLGGEYS